MKIRNTKELLPVMILNDEIFPDDPLDIDSRTRAWLVYDDDRIVGFATLRHLDSGEAYFDRCGILPEYRHRGLHRRLIQVRERYAKRFDLSHIITYVVEGNWNSLGSLVRNSYHIYSPAYEWVGCQQVIYLRKAL